MAFKQKSSGTFKMMGSSPVKKQKVPKISLGMGGEADNNLAKKLSSQPKNFNTKGGVSKTPGHSSTKIAKTQNFRDAANKIKTVSSKTSGKGGKVIQLLKKGGKFLGGKTLGVAGMMGAGTLSATATPKGNQKKKGSYTDDFTKLRK